MPAILLCTGLSSSLQSAIDGVVNEIAGPQNHFRYLSHPLRSVPLPLTPVVALGNCHSLLSGNEDAFLATGLSVVHQRNLLDEWLDAVTTFVAGSGPIILVVDAVYFKSYERWATSRGFPMHDIISNGRTLDTQPQAPVLDIDLALQHLKRQGTSPHTKTPTTPLSFVPTSGDVTSQCEEYLIGIVGQGPVWFHGPKRSAGSSVASILLEEMNRQRAERQKHASVEAVVVTTGADEGKLFLVSPSALQLLVDSVDAVNGSEAALSSTIVGSLTKVLKKDDQIVELALLPSSAVSNCSVLEDYVGSEPSLEHLRTCEHARRSRGSERVGVARTRSYARVGVMGNPSDQLHGKSMAVSIENFWTDVHIFESPSVRFIPNPITDPVEFGGLQDVFALSSGDGYSGGLRLVQATCKRFFQYCQNNNIFANTASSTTWARRGFTIAYETNVPRQVGLAGSSCIVTAVLKALLLHFGIVVLPEAEAQAQSGTGVPIIAKEVLPSIALSAEMDELGIHAGLMDRVIQMYGGLVAMDFTNKAQMESKGYATYRSLDARRLPKLHLAYAIDPSDSGRKHATVKQRWLNGDQEVHDAAKTWASLVDELLVNLEGDEGTSTVSTPSTLGTKLGELMNRNFDLRRKLYGDASLGWKNLRMIEIARSLGAAAKFPGSGGAILIYCDPETVNTWKLKKAMYAEGFVLVSLHYLP